MWTTRFSQWVLVDVLRFQLQPVKVKRTIIYFWRLSKNNVQLNNTQDIVHYWNFALNIYIFTGFEFYCLGSWTDEDGNVWMVVRDRGEDVHRYKYRCLVSLNWKKKQYKKAFQLMANRPLATWCPLYYHMSTPPTHHMDLFKLAHLGPCLWTDRLTDRQTWLKT